VLVQKIQSKSLMLACLLASFLACWLALQSKAATAEKKQVIDFALDAMLVKYRYYIIHAQCLWLPLQGPKSCSEIKVIW
jgi:hypothetical protein